MYSEISRFVLQYLDRSAEHPYDERHEQKPTAFRLKPNTGLVEVDVPIQTRVNYDVSKGLRYGDAMRRSRSARDGGSYGLAGGFSSGAAAGGGKVKMEGNVDVEMAGMDSKEGPDIMRVQTLGGRIKGPEDGDPLHPQLHHIDALDEIPAKGRVKARKEGEEEQTEARAIDVKIKAAEDAEAAMVAGNLELLKKMQDEKWTMYEWVDAETEEAWQTYESYMIQQDLENVPQLEAAIDSEDYLDRMSAPRIDPARPEMTGWAMKQNRKRQKEQASINAQG
ncbi:hypothetical protein ACP6JD_000232 [Aspergillus fumigatus]